MVKSCVGRASKLLCVSSVASIQMGSWSSQYLVINLPSVVSAYTSEVLAGEATERYFSDMNELGYTRGEAADMAAAEKERKE